MTATTDDRLIAAFRLALAHPAWRVACANSEVAPERVHDHMDAILAMLTTFPEHERAETVWAFLGLAIGALNVAKHPEPAHFCEVCFATDMSIFLNGTAAFWTAVANTPREGELQ